MSRFLPTLLLLFTTTATCHAQAFIEHLSPPVLERGKTTRLSVVGSHLTKALDLWTSLPSGKLKATPIGDSKADSAIFDVHVADDAPVGLFGLRVATADGLSNVHLCLLDDLPVRSGSRQCESSGQGGVAVYLVGPLPRGYGGSLCHRSQGRTAR